MDSNLELKINRKNGIPRIELTHSQKRYKRILEHVSTLTQEEIDETLLKLEKLERRK